MTIEVGGGAGEETKGWVGGGVGISAGGSDRLGGAAITGKGGVGIIACETATEETEGFA